MLRHTTRHVRRNAIGYLALFVALSGTSYAVAAGSIGSRQIRDNSIRSKDIRDGNVRAKDVGTARGTFDLIGRTDFKGDPRIDAVSFPFALSDGPEPHVVPVGGSPTAECPGTPARPEAAPGHLCLYEESHYNAGNTGVSTYRFGFTATTVSDVDNVDLLFGTAGTWAVTPR